MQKLQDYRTCAALQNYSPKPPAKPPSCLVNVNPRLQLTVFVHTFRLVRDSTSGLLDSVVMLLSLILLSFLVLSVFFEAVCAE